jgi:hypothetical protein
MSIKVLSAFLTPYPTFLAVTKDCLTEHPRRTLPSAVNTLIVCPPRQPSDNSNTFNQSLRFLSSALNSLVRGEGAIYHHVAPFTSIGILNIAGLSSQIQQVYDDNILNALKKRCIRGSAWRLAGCPTHRCCYFPHAS